MNKSIEIGGETISPGERKTINISVPRLYTTSTIHMPVHVIHGKQEGPRLFVSAAIHGDEINGIEIIHRLINSEELDHLQGTLIAVPVVNVYGFITQSRYLPDRRDLNRSFPGLPKGSMATRLAHVFMQEIVTKCTHGIDLHTGAIGRANLPQIRAKLNQSQEIKYMACAFGAPVVKNSDELLEGSLREAALAHDIPILLYEGGEALRFDELAIGAGVKGIINVMSYLQMLTSTQACDITNKPVLTEKSRWVRAPKSGILRTAITLGSHVAEGDVIGHISDPFGDMKDEVLATACGIIIGQTKLPLVYEGDALFHIAFFHEPSGVLKAIEELHETHGDQDN